MVRNTQNKSSSIPGNLLDHFRLHDKGLSHDILLIRVKHLHVCGDSFAVLIVVDGESVSEAEIQDRNDDRHDRVN